MSWPTERATCSKQGRHDHDAARTVQAVVQRAAKDAGLEKHVHPRLLRHKVAT
ncbi:hypothetical protein E7T06_18865 [Deinococcus sp. Arct2-2]|nr:hypothetical protein E7T06_18865 [Deinococcus sp. Arct2-2]